MRLIFARQISTAKIRILHNLCRSDFPRRDRKRRALQGVRWCLEPRGNRHLNSRRASKQCPELQSQKWVNQSETPKKQLKTTHTHSTYHCKLASSATPVFKVQPATVVYTVYPGAGMLPLVVGGRYNDPSSVALCGPEGAQQDTFTCCKPHAKDRDAMHWPLWLICIVAGFRVLQHAIGATERSAEGRIVSVPFSAAQRLVAEHL